MDDVVVDDVVVTTGWRLGQESSEVAESVKGLAYFIDTHSERLAMQKVF